MSRTRQKGSRWKVSKLKAVHPAEDLMIEVTWETGERANRTERIDLAPVINSKNFFEPLRSDRALFETVHLAAYGFAIAWGEEDEFDLSTTTIENLAEDMMTSEDLRAFFEQMGYTHKTAAAQLGYTPRHIENFLSGASSIPRVCVLACKELKARAEAVKEAPKREEVSKLLRIEVVDYKHVGPLSGYINYSNAPQTWLSHPRTQDIVKVEGSGEQVLVVPSRPGRRQRHAN